MLNRRLKQATSCRIGVNYFLTAGESTLTAGESTLTAGESTLTTGESTLTTGESALGASVVAVSPLLQAVNTDATAIAKNTFFICFCLIFKNYNFIFIP